MTLEKFFLNSVFPIFEFTISTAPAASMILINVSMMNSLIIKIERTPVNALFRRTNWEVTGSRDSDLDITLLSLRDLEAMKKEMSDSSGKNNARAGKEPIYNPDAMSAPIASSKPFFHNSRLLFKVARNDADFTLEIRSELSNVSYRDIVGRIRISRINPKMLNVLAITTESSTVAIQVMVSPCSSGRNLIRLVMGYLDIRPVSNM